MAVQPRVFNGPLGPLSPHDTRAAFAKESQLQQVGRTSRLDYYNSQHRFISTDTGNLPECCFFVCLLLGVFFGGGGGGVALEYFT